MEILDLANFIVAIPFFSYLLWLLLRYFKFLCVSVTAVYIVTGKLGSGKTLLAVQKIQDYLRTGRSVAVNIDVRMEKLCKPDNRYSRLVRLPDLPTADDLIGLGMGCE